MVPAAVVKPYSASVHVAILGAAEAHLDGVPVELGTRKQRALLAALAMHRGRPVSADMLVDLLWGTDPPAAVTATLQGYVARLRRALEPDRPARARSQVLVTQQTGYALLVPADALDAARFEASVGTAHDRLGSVRAAEGLTRQELHSLVDDLTTALGLWRGQPYTELEDAPAAQAERGRLEELRVTALEDRAVAALALGRHAMVAGELEVLTVTYPLRERLWGLRALALTRSGRQADALDVLRQVRELLADELGLEPGPELRDLQAAVLRQDPALAWSTPGRTTTEPTSPPVRRPMPHGTVHGRGRLAPGRPGRRARRVGRRVGAVPGASGLRCGLRRAGHRQEPAVRRAGPARRVRGRDRRGGPVLAGRGGPAALPVGRRARRAGARAALLGGRGGL